MSLDGPFHSLMFTTSVERVPIVSPNECFFSLVVLLGVCRRDSTNSQSKRVSPNEFVFQNLVVSSPNVGIFRFISFLQKWKILIKKTDQQWIDMVIRKLNLQLSSLRSEG
jgi:hypothetical protein